ncbi:MAG: tetratricopeptide repeat protein [Candidatus Hodarchaeota archaeon]
MANQRSAEKALKKCIETPGKDYSAMAACLKEVLDQATDCGSRIAVLGELGCIQTQAGRYSEAKKTFFRLLEFSKRALLDEGAVNAQIGLASVAAKQGQTRVATNFAEKSLQLSKAIGYSWGEAKSNHHLAIAKWMEKSLLDSERFINRAINLWQNIQDNLGLAESLNVAGAIFEAKGDRKTAITTYSRAHGLFESLGKTRQIALILNNIAIANKRLGAYDQANEHYLRTISLTREINDLSLCSTFMRNYSELLRERGDNESARSYLDEALRLRKSADDLLGIASLLGDLGDLSYHCGDVEEAIHFYRNSLQIDENSGSQAGSINRLVQYIRVLVDAELMLEAKQILQKAKSLSTHHRSLIEIGWVNFARGYYAKAENNVDKARNSLKAAHRIATKVQDPELIFLINLLLIEIRLEAGSGQVDKGQIEQAYRYIAEAQEVARSSGRFVGLVDFLLIEALLLGLQFRFDDALERVQEAITICLTMRLAQIKRVRIVETVLHQRSDMTGTQEAQAMLHKYYTQNLLNFIDSVTRKRPSSRKIL